MENTTNKGKYNINITVALASNMGYCATIMIIPRFRDLYYKEIAVTSQKYLLKTVI